MQKKQRMMKLGFQMGIFPKFTN